MVAAGIRAGSLVEVSCSRQSVLGGVRRLWKAMGDIHEVGRARINTSMLAQYIGQPVCFVGRVEKVSSPLHSERACDVCRSLLTRLPPVWTERKYKQIPVWVFLG